MNIAGIVKSSFIDYPGCASTVIFLGGCNFNCGYCHNPEIVRCGGGDILVSDFLEFLKQRKKFLDAVCISGGEPTLYGDELFELIRRIKDLGYRIKLDTNGTNPELLKRLIHCGNGQGLIDYAAMDIKGPWEKYGEIAQLDRRERGNQGQGGSAAVNAVQESLAILLASGKQDRETAPFCYELRTTVCRELLGRQDIERMAEQLAGARCWYLQTFKQQAELLDAEKSFSAFTPREMEELRAAAEEAAAGKIGEIRVR